MKKYLILIATLPLCIASLGQVFVNSYGSTFVSEAGLFGSKKNTNQIVLSPIDSVKRNMIAKDFYKSSEPVLVNLFPLFLSSKDTVDRSIVYKQEITATNATSVSISFDELSLSENAILYLYNSEGTVVTGPIRAKENVGSGKLNKAWRSNSFVGNSIILELKIPMDEVNQNKLHIIKSILGYLMNPTVA